MTFFKSFRVHDIRTGEQLFRGAGLCAQQVYEDFRRHKGHKVGVSNKELDSLDPITRAIALRKLSSTDDWIDDASIFMVAEEGKR